MEAGEVELVDESGALGPARAERARRRPWARDELAGSVDVLVVDEAGQVSLANAVAVSRAATPRRGVDESATALRVGTAAALEQIADLASALGEPERSLRLLAAAQRFRTDTGIARWPHEADRFARVRGTAEAALDPAAATACWGAGRELSLADAVSYVRRGRGERHRPQLGWASLTPVERDVVRLVAGGHANAEIGRRLFISVNTVKKHLSHVYTKVDVEGRADLAAQVARRDL